MKAYYFLSKRPKFETEFLTDGSKPPANHARTIQKSQVNVDAKQEDFIPGTANTFVKIPSMNAQPTGREHLKKVGAINFMIDKVTEKDSAPAGSSGVKKCGKNQEEDQRSQQSDEVNQKQIKSRPKLHLPSARTALTTCMLLLKVKWRIIVN